MNRLHLALETDFGENARQEPSKYSSTRKVWKIFFKNTIVWILCYLALPMLFIGKFVCLLIIPLFILVYLIVVVILTLLGSIDGIIIIHFEYIWHWLIFILFIISSIVNICYFKYRLKPNLEKKGYIACGYDRIDINDELLSPDVEHKRRIQNKDSLRLYHDSMFRLIVNRYEFYKVYNYFIANCHEFGLSKDIARLILSYLVGWYDWKIRSTVQMS